jgi:hypothetical protein
VSCHGKVNEMPVVYHAKPHSMDWCLDCHREPEHALRPLNQITNLDWKPEVKEGETEEEAQDRQGKELKHNWRINPPDISCAGCHR